MSQDNGSSIGIVPAPPAPPIIPGTGSVQRNTVAHADILNFVAKQQSKSIATKELFRHLIFTVVSSPSIVWFYMFCYFGIYFISFDQAHIFLTIVALHRYLLPPFSWSKLVSMLTHILGQCLRATWWIKACRQRLLLKKLTSSCKPFPRPSLTFIKTKNCEMYGKCISLKL